jgi:DNA polymerase-3 subunit gamma/tau
LKTLEEPPAHVVFVLATTDPQKVSATIRSRTQHLEFRLLSAEVLDHLVREVAAADGLEVTPDAIESVVHQGAGSARDTLSALDQVLAAGGTLEESEPLDEIVEALITEDTARALTAVALAIDAGRDPRTLSEHLVAHLRDAFLSLMNPQLVRLPDRMATTVADQAQRLGAAATVRAMEVLGETLVDLRHAPDPRLLLDVALVRLTRRDADVSPAALLARIERLERAAGGPAPPPAGPAASPRAGVAPAGAAPASTPVAPDRPAPPTSDRPSERATLGARARRPPNEPPAPSAPPAPAPAVAAAKAEAGPPSPPAEADARPFPSRDALTLAWADHVVPRLKGMARALFLPGRFVAADGTAAVFALPNQQQIAKCEPYRAEVERVLAAEFHRPVPLRLVLDDEADSGDDRRTTPSPEDDAVDLSELVDAPPGSGGSGIERLTKAFPGAQLIDE